jgi:Tfp pilus assembly protein PilF
MISHHSATRASARLLAGVAIVLVSVACGSGRSNGADTAKQSAGASEDQLMSQGLAQMYQNNDPFTAQETFRAVIRKNPTHYGAHYQLAVALDRSGKPTEGRAAWEDMRQRAGAIRDTATLGTIQRRLASPDTASPDATMALGLYYLYKKNDAAAAAQEFRKVIAKIPTHYGATYQLAKALDLAGQRAQATPLWQKVLGMATQYRDERTIQQAKERLK